MFTSTARVATIHAKRCVTRLCRHWAHRFAVELNAEKDSGSIFFDPARCELSTEQELLCVLIRSPEADALDALERVVAEHVQRMTADEVLQFDWQRSH